MCLDGGESCLNEVELTNGNGARKDVNTSSMVMLSAIFEDENTLKLKAFTDNYYNSSSITESNYYKATFDLSKLSNNHANANFQYVGFSLADRDFKIYGIGWESETYGSECFDGPPNVKCSFAAKATEGVIPTYGNGLGQSMDYQKPWVGHSGWFDSKNCSPAYSYTYGLGGSSDIYTLSETDGYKFSQDGAGVHGYRDNKTDIKTAFASLSCTASDAETRAWEVVEPANCGRFWTGMQTECKQDASLLNSDVPASGYSIYAGGQWSQTFSPKNLRGDTLTIALSNEYEYNVDLEVWLESKNDAWGATNFESRHVRITGNNKVVSREIIVVDEFADNASGFDPENVVAIVFQNNGENAVTVNSAQASCKNAVKFDGCSVKKNGETGWEIALNVSKNKDKVSKINLSATVDGENYNGLSKYEFDGGTLTLNVSDSDIFSNAGKTYAFRAQVISETNNYESENVTCSCEGSDCSIGTITCSDAKISKTEIKLGEASPSFDFKLNGCPAKGCAYEVTLNHNKFNECTNAQAQGAGCGSEHSVTGATQASVGEYTYRVVNPNGSKTTITDLDKCEKTFKVVEKTSVVANCSFVPSSVATGGNVTLNMTNIQNLDANTTFTISGGSGSTTKVLSSGATSGSVSLTAPSSANTYTYTVTYNDNGEKTVCTANLTVLNGLSCSVNSGTITLGENFTFTPTWDGSCSSAGLTGNGTITGNPGSGCNATSFTVTPTSIGDLEYTYTFSGDIGSNLTCKQTVTVNPPAPEFSCPDNWSGTVGSEVTLTLGDDVNYCKINGSNVCTMKIDGIDNNFVSYVNPRKFTDNGATTSTNNYTVSLRNSTGTTSLACNITYTAVSSSSAAVSSSSSAGGGCTCVAFVNGTGGGYGDCYKSGLENMGDGKCYALNPDRKPFTDQWINNNASDGYWWTEVSCTNWTGCSGGGGGASSSSAAPSSSSAGGGGGDYVNVDLSGSVARDFNVGTSYKITKCGTDTKNLKCDANGGGKELYVNGSKVWTSFDWQNLTGNYQSAGDRCVVGNIITVKNGMIRCVNGW